LGFRVGCKVTGLGSRAKVLRFGAKGLGFTESGAKAVSCGAFLAKKRLELAHLKVGLGFRV
jgi:hypothetical protein